MRSPNATTQFLSVLADRNIHIPTYEKAVEGISGAACLYLIFATILTCCLGGITFLAILAIVIDVLFCAAFIGVIVLTRHGASSCKGNSINTPLGVGPASADNGFGRGGFGFSNHDNATYSVHLGLACRFNTACFACAIICAILFLCTAGMQVALMRHHKKEKRYGPSPDNNYTSGYGKKGMFSRFGRNKNNSAKAAEAGAYTSPKNNRASAETGYTNGTNGTNGVTNGTSDTYVAGGAHSGYYNAPTGTTAQNPYGYSNNTGTNY